VSVVRFRRSPASGRDAADAIRAGRSWLAGGGRAIAVGGGKGGTGKSLITANLAVLASLRGRGAIAVDADLGLANLHLLLGIDPEADLSSLLDARRAVGPGDLLAAGPAGVRLLPGASGVARLAGLNRGELRRLVERLESHLPGDGPVFFDLSSGLSPATQLFLRAAHEVVIVANPEPTAVLDAYGVVKMLAEGGHAGRIHLVMNRARDPRAAEEFAGRIADTARQYLDRGVDVLGAVPEDEAVAASIQRRRPVVLDRPQSPAAAALRTIAQRLLVDAEPAADTLGAFFSTARGLLAPRSRVTRSSCAS